VLAAEAREADRAASERFGLPSIVLMEHAGRGLALLVAQRLRPRDEVAVLCGPGNNGGDGYAAARFLRSWGIPVRVVRCAASSPRGGDAAIEHDALSREAEIAVAASLGDARVVEAALSGATAVVDALFGTGPGRPLEAPYVEWIARVNETAALRVAADLPSGLRADDGVPAPVAVRADVTAAMGFVKRGCVTAEGAPYCGEVVEIDIGLPAAVHRRYLAE
jgi:NAD(P)H-hydrate epimerase